MLRHFLLIFPTGFEGVLATYQTPLSSFFPQGFGGNFIKMMSPHKIKHWLGEVLELINHVLIMGLIPACTNRRQL